MLVVCMVHLKGWIGAIGRALRRVEQEPAVLPPCSSAVVGSFVASGGNTVRRRGGRRGPVALGTPARRYGKLGRAAWEEVPIWRSLNRMGPLPALRPI